MGFGSQLYMTRELVRDHPFRETAPAPLLSISVGDFRIGKNSESGYDPSCVNCVNPCFSSDSFPDRPLNGEFSVYLLIPASRHRPVYVLTSTSHQPGFSARIPVGLSDTQGMFAQFFGCRDRGNELYLRA